MTVKAQWSDDPAQNKILVADSGDQVQPKTVSDGAGGFYISWFSSTGGYDVYLQRFGSDGNSLWKTGSVLVADRSFSSTQDYGLAVTDDGSAVLAFRGVAGAAQAVLVSPDGKIQWSVDANQSSGTVDKPEVAVASDGGILVGWINGNSSMLRRLTQDGAMSWVSPLPLTDGSNTAAITDIQPGGDSGEVIVSMVTYATFTGPKRLKARKVLSDGSFGWVSNKSVFITGSLQFGAYPSFISDGEGGGFFWWYEVTPLQCRVQRLDTNGNALYGNNGSTATASSSGAERTNPMLAFDASEQLLVMTWIEYGGSSLYGYSAQRFDPIQGTRLWGDTGLSVMPLIPSYYDILGSSVVIVDGNILTAWVPRKAWGQGEVLCSCFDQNANEVWTNISICTAVSDHYPLLGIDMDTEAVFVWNDDRSSNEDIYGQNIQLDGTLGGSGCTEDLNGDGKVNGEDLGLFLVQWGVCMECVADFTDDGVVNGADLGLMMVAWGNCPG